MIYISAQINFDDELHIINVYEPKKGHLNTYGNNGRGGQYVYATNRKNWDSGSGR